MTKEFAGLLGQHMKREKVNQRVLGDQAGIDHSTISRLLKGDRNATAEIAIGLADGLGVPAVDLAEFLLSAAGHEPGVVREAIGVLKQEAVKEAKVVTPQINRVSSSH